MKVKVMIKYQKHYMKKVFNFEATKSLNFKQKYKVESYKAAN